MEIKQCLGDKKEYWILWIISILASLSWLFGSNIMDKAEISFFAACAVLVLGIIICSEFPPFKLCMITLGAVNVIAFIITCMTKDDPSFHGCFPSVFYIAVELVMYIGMLVPLFAVGVAIFLIKLNFIKKRNPDN